MSTTRLRPKGRTSASVAATTALRPKNLPFIKVVSYQPREVLTGETLRLRPQPFFVPNDVATGQNFPGLVSYRTHEVLTAGASQGKLVSEWSRPGSARSAFQAA